MEIDWKALTPEQRNQIVAEKVMGWQQKACEGEIGEQPVSPDGWFCQRCGYSGYWGDDQEHQELPKSYSTDIGAAWLIVEKLPFDFRIRKYRPPIAVYGVYCDSSIDESFSFQGLTKSAPEAICIAALRAIGYEVIV